MEYASAESGRADTLTVRDPENGEIVGEVTVADESAIERALSTADVAARRAPLPAFERSAILLRVMEQVRRDRLAFAELIAHEGIKTIREAEREVARCAETLRLSAEEARRIGGEVIPMDQVAAGVGKLGLTTRRPAGIVVAITPFNDPLNLLAHKIGPAVALGAPVILKPHPQTPLSAARLQAAFREAGLPPDLLQTVNGGPAAGARLVEDPRPRVVSFTGGRVAGNSIGRHAGLKKLMLEMGGVSSVVVAADADLEGTARSLHAAAFWAAGQNCLHAQRVIVDRAIEPDLTARLLALTETMRLGPKREPATDMGCLVDESAVQRILKLMHQGLDAGAELLSGGTADGTRFAPTWLRTTKAGNPLTTDEVFGPVTLIEPVDDFDDAVKRIRAAPPALHVAVFTESLARALAIYEAANAATVLVNESTDFRIDAMPFGGVGAAGLEREGVRHAIEAMAETRLLILQNKASR